MILVPVKTLLLLLLVVQGKFFHREKGLVNIKQRSKKHEPYCGIYLPAFSSSWHILQLGKDVEESSNLTHFHLFIWGLNTEPHLLNTRHSILDVIFWNTNTLLHNFIARNLGIGFVLKLFWMELVEWGYNKTLWSKYTGSSEMETLICIYWDKWDCILISFLVIFNHKVS